MGGINAAIEVGKEKLDVALGAAGEQFTEANEPAPSRGCASGWWQRAAREC